LFQKINTGCHGHLDWLLNHSTDVATQQFQLATDYTVDIRAKANRLMKNAFITSAKIGAGNVFTLSVC